MESLPIAWFGRTGAIVTVRRDICVDVAASDWCVGVHKYICENDHIAGNLFGYLTEIHQSTDKWDGHWICWKKKKN